MGRLGIPGGMAGLVGTSVIIFLLIVPVILYHKVPLATEPVVQAYIAGASQVSAATARESTDGLPGITIPWEWVIAFDAARTRQQLQTIPATERLLRAVEAARAFAERHESRETHCSEGSDGSEGSCVTIIHIWFTLRSLPTVMEQAGVGDRVTWATDMAKFAPLLLEKNIKCTPLGGVRTEWECHPKDPR